MPQMVARPVPRARPQHIELKGHDALQEVRARGGGEAGRGVEDAEEVRALGGGLVEEAHAREGGEAEVPELGACGWRARAHSSLASSLALVSWARSKRKGGRYGGTGLSGGSGCAGSDDSTH